MLPNTFIQVVIISIIIIYSLHYLWTYMQPIQKIKRNQNNQIQKYKKMIADLQSKQPESLFSNEFEKQQMMDEILSNIQG